VVARCNDTRRSPARHKICKSRDFLLHDLPPRECCNGTCHHTSMSGDWHRAKHSGRSPDSQWICDHCYISGYEGESEHPEDSEDLGNILGYIYKVPMTQLHRGSWTIGNFFIPDTLVFSDSSRLTKWYRYIGRLFLEALDTFKIRRAIGIPDNIRWHFSGCAKSSLAMSDTLIIITAKKEKETSNFRSQIFPSLKTPSCHSSSAFYRLRSVVTRKTTQDRSLSFCFFVVVVVRYE